MNPTTTLHVVIGLAVVICLSVLIPYLNWLRLLAGYYELRRDVRALQRFLRGETFRDADDLAVTGSTHGLRTTIRFSRRENMPGVNIRMQVPSTFDLIIGSKEFPLQEEFQWARSDNPALDARWRVQAKEPAQVRMFLASDTVTFELQKLACSSSTLISLEPGAMELSEPTTPLGSRGRHFLAHMESMSIVARQLSRMPGASRVKLERVVPARPTGKVVIALLAAAALGLSVFGLADYQRIRRDEGATSTVGGSPQGIPPDEASQIPNLQGWRLSGVADFDADLAGWLRKSNVVPSGRLEGDFSGTAGNDHAYLLTNGESHRLLVLVGNQVKFDETFPAVAIVAKVPSAAIRDVKIDTGSAATGNSDGILLVRERNNVRSGILLSFRGGSPITAVPANYTSIAVN
jgi:hypothetical protein